MKRRTLHLAFSALAATVILGIAAPSASVHAGTEDTSASRFLSGAEETSDTTARFMAARARAGLDGSRARTEELEADAAATRRGAQFGFPVADSELDDLVDRYDVQRGSSTVLRFAEERYPETYGGGWVDIANGRVVAMFTDSDHGRLAALRSAARRPDVVVIEQVRFSLRQLLDAANAIFVDRGAAADMEANATLVDERLNRVRVYVDDPPIDASERLSAAYGIDSGALVVIAADGASQEFTTPLGGHALTGCSTGAYAYIDSAFGRLPYLVTAGHCSDTQRHRSGGTPTGALHLPEYQMAAEWNATSADVQTMQIAGQLVPTTAKVEGWQTSDFTLTSEAAAGGDFDRVGAVVCNAGAWTGGRGNCGSIISTNFNCGDQVGMRAVDPIATGGDSGGTVYGFIYLQLRVPLVGFIEGTCNFIQRYTFAWNARAALGLSGWIFG